MRVPVEHHGHGIAVERLLEAAGAQKRVNLERFALDGFLYGRIMQERHERARPQPCERRLELERFVHRLTHELLDYAFAPRRKRVLAEPTAEAFDPRHADAGKLACVALEHHETGVSHDRRDLFGVAGLKIVIAQDGRGRHSKRPELFRQHASFVLQSVVREVAGDEQHIGRFPYAVEDRLEGALRRSRTVQVSQRGHADDGRSHARGCSRRTPSDPICSA